MSDTELKRPEMKVNAAPLTEADKYGFLPYVDREAGILPSERDSWKTDELAQAFMKALETGEDMSQTDWSGVNLKGANLAGQDLSGLNLSKANLMNADLSGAKLEWTNLSYAYLENTDFSNADMKNVQMDGVFVKNIKLDGADIDEETKKYLDTCEWFLDQLEQGKIDIASIPQDQLNYLDLRTIDMSQVDTEGVDLHALILTGVNLSGVYIDKRHFLNMALMEKAKQKALILMQRTRQFWQAALRHIMQERQEKMKRYAAEQLKKKQQVQAYAFDLKRPALKPALLDEKDLKTDTNTGSSGATEPPQHTDKSAEKMPQKARMSVSKLTSQKRKVKQPKTNFKKRA